MNHNTQETRSIEDIVKMIDDGKLVLPEFQRDFKWPLEKTETLFDSIFNNLFIGSLIISRPKFDLACKAFDIRPRGSRAHKPKERQYLSNEFEENDIYTLLDGQQRTTSIYRALKGKDFLYIIFKDLDELSNPEWYDEEEEVVKVSYTEYIEGFSTSIPRDGEFYLRVCDLYDARDHRDKNFIKKYVDPQLEEFKISQEKKELLRSYASTLKQHFKTYIIGKDSLLSVQLLNMDLEMFCLYFERSNSQGLNLSFTDIITAKIYIDFKLQREISSAKSDEQIIYFDDKLVQPLVRYINYKANGDVTKKSILKDLRGEHFTDYWHEAVKDLDYIQQWLEQNWMFHVSSIPYRTMLLPILAFYQNLPNKEFAAGASKEQLDVLRFWFYASIFDTRYGGARHGSTNVVLKQDCDIFSELAKGNFPDTSYWHNLRIQFSYEEMRSIDNNSNVKYLAISYYMWSKNNFKNFENDGIVSFNKKGKSIVDVHHIIPDNYIKKIFTEDSVEYDISNSVLNKARINKISNIKIGDKAPSKYLSILKDKYNSSIHDSLLTHGINDSEGLLAGNYDKDFKSFLKMRYDSMLPHFEELKLVSQRLQNGEYQDLWVFSS